MKSKFTAQFVLEMLQEVKSLSDKNMFISTRFTTKYPSFYSFRKILIEKNLLEKKKNKEKWVGIEPNMIMAKAIATLREKRFKEANEKRSFGLNKEDLLRMVEQKKALDKQEELEKLKASNQEETTKQEQIEETKDDVAKIYSLKSIQKLERQLQEAQNSNASLIRQIGQIQNSKFLGREFVSSYEAPDAKVQKLREVIHIRDKELENIKKEIIQYENSFNSLQELSIEKINLLNEKDKIIYDKDKLIENEKQKLQDFKETIKNQKQEINDLMDMVSEQREFIVQEKKSEKNLKKLKKLKVFGITVYSLEFN